MKRIFAVALLGAVSAFAQVPSTPNLGLQLPPYSTPNWNVPVNVNMQIIDQWASTVPNFQGPWSSTVTYGKSAIVSYLGVNYISLVSGNLDNIPVSTPSDWAIFSGGGGLVPPNASLLGGTGTAFSSIFLGSGLTLVDGILSSTGGAANPAGPAFAVNFANSTVSAFQGDFAGANVVPSTHTFYSQNISNIPQAVAFYSGSGSDIIAAINAAYATLPSTGGVIDGRTFPSGSYTSTTQLSYVVGGTKPITLLLNPATRITMNTVQAAPCALPFANGSSIITQGNNSGSGNSAYIAMGASFSGTGATGGSSAAPINISSLAINAEGTLTITLASSSTYAVGDDIAIYGTNGAHGQYLNMWHSKILTQVGNTITMAVPTSVGTFSTEAQGQGYVEPNPTGLICNANQAAQESFVMDGVQLYGNTSAINPGPLLLLKGLFVDTAIVNSATHTCGHSCVQVEVGSSTQGSTDLYFGNDNLADESSIDHPGAIVTILGGGAQGGNANHFTFVGGAIQFPGAHSPLVYVNGFGNGFTQGLFAKFGVDYEAGASTAGANWANVDPVQLYDMKGYWSNGDDWTGDVSAPGSGGPTHMYDLYQTDTSSPSASFNVDWFSYYSAYTSAMTSVVNNINWGGQTWAENFTQCGSSSTCGAIHFQALGGNFHDNISWLPLTSVPTSLPNRSMFWNETADGVQLIDRLGNQYEMINANDLLKLAIVASNGSDVLAGIGSMGSGSSTTPTGWSITGGCSGPLTCVYTRDTTTAPAGYTASESIDVTANSSSTGITVGANMVTSVGTYSFTGGQYYQVAFSAKTDGVTNAYPQLSVQNLSGTSVYCLGNVKNAALSSSWQLFQFTCIPTSTASAYVRFGGEWVGGTGGTGTLWVGGLTVSPIQQLPTASILSSIGPYAIGAASTAQLTTTVNGTACLLGSSCTVSGSSGVSSINSTTGAFTFTGSGVSCTSTTCTFSGTGSGVTSVAQTVPPWLTVSGSPITSSGTLAITAATGQTSHEVIGTCGTATSFGPCALVAGDIPALPYLSSSTQLANSISAVSHEWLNSYNAGTGNFTQTQPAFTDISGAATVAQLPTGIPNANLANVSTTVNSQTCTLGASCTVPGTISGLTSGIIPKASSATALTNSGLSDSGTALTYTGSGSYSLIQPGTNVFSALPTCNSGQEGSMAPVTDSTTNTWGATITGSGSDHVLAYCDGTNWTVAGK